MSPCEIQGPLVQRWLGVSEFPDQSTFREGGVNRHKGKLAHSFMMSCLVFIKKICKIEFGKLENVSIHKNHPILI